MISFDELWKLHWGWRKGLFLEKIISHKTVDIYKGIPQNEYTCFALPKVTDPMELDFNEVEQYILPKGTLIREAYYPISLLSKNCTPEFYSHLIKNNYLYPVGIGSWLVYDGDFQLYSGLTKFREEDFLKNIFPITLRNFSDYTDILDQTDKDFSVLYYTIYKKMLEEQETGESKDIKVEFYGVYEENKPICVGPLIYSQEKNFAFIPLGDILPEYHLKHQKNYAFRLLQYRLNKAIQLGITTIYSMTASATPAWRDLMLLDFKEVQEERIFLKHKVDL